MTMWIERCEFMMTQDLPKDRGMAFLLPKASKFIFYLC
jgi:uncharacterized membrane protein (UPF0127 family)